MAWPKGNCSTGATRDPGGSPFRSDVMAMAEVRCMPRLSSGVHGGSDLELGLSIFPKRIPYEQWGAVWSYLEFSNHLLVSPTNQWPFQEPKLEVPYIRPIFQANVKEYPHKILPYMDLYGTIPPFQDPGISIE